MSPLRRAAKRDANEAQIVAALRAAGCTVQRLSEPGVPDLLVGRQGRDGRGVNYLLEVKDPREGHLTREQDRWLMGWNGHYAIVTSEIEALQAVGLRDSNNER